MDINKLIQDFTILAPPFLLGLTVHEFAHGYVAWRTDETIPVGFGTIQVVPVWRFLLEMDSRT